MESVDVTHVDLHVGRRVVILVDTGESRLLEPERGCVEYWRPALPVVRSRCVTCVIGVERSALGWQLTDNLWNNRVEQINIQS